MASNSRNTPILNKLQQHYENKKKVKSLSINVTETRKPSLPKVSTPKTPPNAFQDDLNTTIGRAPIVNKSTACKLPLISADTSNPPKSNSKPFAIQETLVYRPSILTTSQDTKTEFRKEIKKRKSSKFSFFGCFA